MVDVVDFKNRLIKYVFLISLIVIATQVAVYSNSGLTSVPVYVALVVSGLTLTIIALGHFLDYLSTHTAAKLGLLTVSLLLIVTPVMRPTDALHPTWYLVLVLFSYIFFSRRFSLILMILIYGYFILYAVFIIPGFYSLEEVITLTTSMFVTAVLCHLVSRESGELFKRLAVAANTDPMTGLWNRRGVEKLFEEISGLEASSRPFYSVAVFDLDNFKSVNDQRGHKMGDNVIELAAEVIRSNVRKSDIAARIGGEEFLLVMPNDVDGSAENVAERIRKSFEVEVLSFVGEQFLNVSTISVGVVYRLPIEVSLSDAVDLGDKMLYRAKQLGRNRVVACSYDDLQLEAASTALRPVGA